MGNCNDADTDKTPNEAWPAGNSNNANANAGANAGAGIDWHTPNLQNATKITQNSWELNEI